MRDTLVNVRSVKKTVKGFTLIEISIVLVIAGLLMGTVLKGQELITSARVRNLIAQQDSNKAAFYGFMDRYRNLPGDYAGASTSINCGATVCANGDANGQIQAPNAAGLHEEILAWQHLSAAGFLSEKYAMANLGTATPDVTNTPQNAYFKYLQLTYDGIYGMGTIATPNSPRHNLKTGTLIPVAHLTEIDRKIDDGKPFTGLFQFSLYTPENSDAPNAATCTTATDWNVTSEETNCGGVTIF